MREIYFFALISAALAASINSNRIVGGSDTDIQTYPFMANMNVQFYGQWQQACGGALISATTVLSAAHCFVDEFEDNWRVRLGSNQRNSGGSIHYVAQFIIHPDFSEINYDGAIVRLQTPAIFSSSIKPARIASSNYNPPDGTPVTSVGWGTLVWAGSHPETLQHVTTNIINQELCVERYSYLNSLPQYEHYPDVTPMMICAGILNVGGQSVCHGDSGGPLVHQGDIIIGITSWGFNCAHNFYPDVYARVSALNSWIQANA